MQGLTFRFCLPLFLRSKSNPAPIQFQSNSNSAPIENWRCIGGELKSGWICKGDISLKVGIISIACPSVLHRFSIETMDQRWRCDGEAMEMLRRNRVETAVSLAMKNDMVKSVLLFKFLCFWWCCNRILWVNVRLKCCKWDSLMVKMYNFKHVDIQWDMSLKAQKHHCNTTWK